MTRKPKFEDLELEILNNSKLAIKSAKRAVKDELADKDEAADVLNDYLVRQHRKWFLLHRVNMGDE